MALIGRSNNQNEGKPVSTFQLTPEITHKIAMWFTSGDTGVSSETIASIALGRTEPARYHWDTPSDGGDFGRCYRLLQAIPELRAALPLVVELCPKWGPLVEVWDELTALYEQDEAEEPIYEKISRGRGRPRLTRQVNKRACYDRIHELYDACMIAGGWTQTSPGYWSKGGGL